MRCKWEVRGGILADKPGTGKTVTLLGLLAAECAERGPTVKKENEEEDIGNEEVLAADDDDDLDDDLDLELETKKMKTIKDLFFRLDSLSDF